MKNVVKDENVDGLKVALAIRQLVNCEVLHECYDIDDEGVESILQRYGIFYRWTDEEKAILKEHLYDMAASEEIKEAERWAEREADPLLLLIPDRPSPRYLTLDLKHKAEKEEAKAQKTDESGKVKPDSIQNSILKKDIKIEVV